MIPVRGYTDKKVAVLGLGRSGLSAALALQAGGAIPIVWDDNADACQKAEDLGLTVLDLNKDKNWDEVVTLILSPGIAHLYPEPHPIVMRAWAHDVVVDNDIGLFFKSYSTGDWDMFDMMPRVVCITGSNGKSTTTALITHILTQAGKSVQMGGNIGRGVLDLNPAKDGEIVVLELSSYQTDLARSLTPDVGVFMNLSADHLDRHNGMGGYFAAKRRLFIEGGPERAIIGVDEIEGKYLANEMRQEVGSGDPVITISSAQKLQGQGWSVFARKGFLSEWRKGRQVGSADLRKVVGLPGAHNHQNACAAYAVCRSLGLSPKVIEAALFSFPGLPHRCQVVGTGNGITFINDSKATNVDAAEKALLAFKNIHWIVGGEAKEGGISDLIPLMDRVKSAYLIGEAADLFSKQLGDTPHKISKTIELAVTDAVANATEGDVVLLAPACASFDQYPNFELRGDAFLAAVNPHLTT